MQKIFLLFLLSFPFGIIAQTNTETKESHQKADARIQELYPNAQKVDLAKLNKVQKNQHKDCKTCGKNKKINKISVNNSDINNRDILKAEESRLLILIKEIYSSESSDKNLLLKYKNALEKNQQEIKDLESKEANLLRIQKETELKRTR